MVSSVIRPSIAGPRQGRRGFLLAAVRAAAAILGIVALGPASAGEMKTAEVAVKGGKVVGANTFKVKQGDTVVLRWTSDKALEIHLHGYDVEAKLAPGKTTEMKVNARATGRFPVEVHEHDKKGGHGHKALFHLEVHPN
jgi:hypothetical protein